MRPLGFKLATIFYHGAKAIYLTFAMAWTTNGNRHKKPIENIAIISYNKDHTTGQVALYVKKINEYLSAKYPNITYWQGPVAL